MDEDKLLEENIKDWFKVNDGKNFNIQILTVKALSYFQEVRLDKSYLDAVFYRYLNDLIRNCEDIDIVVNLPYFKNLKFPVFLKTEKGNPFKYYVPIDISDKFLKDYDDSLDSFYAALKILFYMIEKVEYQEAVAMHVRNIFIEKLDLIQFEIKEEIYNNKVVPVFSFEEKI